MYWSSDDRLIDLVRPRLTDGESITAILTPVERSLSWVELLAGLVTPVAGLGDHRRYESLVATDRRLFRVGVPLIGVQRKVGHTYPLRDVRIAHLDLPESTVSLFSTRGILRLQIQGAEDHVVMFEHELYNEARTLAMALGWIPTSPQMC